MDFHTRKVIGDLVSQIARLEERLERAERAQSTPQLPNSSLTGGAIRVVDADGTDRGSIGFQTDGTVAVVARNGPTPPKPSTPTVSAGPLSLTVAWDGLFAIGDDGDPSTQPMDFDHVQVHLSATSGFTPDATTMQGSLSTPGSLVVSPLVDGTTYYAVLVPVNTSGITGAASDPASGVPDAVVSGEVLDGSITTIKLADDAVTAAKIAAAAVGTTEIADDAVTTPKVVAGAIQTAQLDAGAVNADKIAANAVTTAKLDALAVTSDKIAANAITAGKINAGAVTAGTIAAGAVTASTLESTMVVATTMQSTNYVAGSAGWRIDGTGSAEFNNTSARGTVIVGPTTSPYAQVELSTINQSGANTGTLSFPTSNTGETVSAQVYYNRTSRSLIVQGSQHSGSLNIAPTITLTDSDTVNNNAIELRVGGGAASIYMNGAIGATLGSQLFDSVSVTPTANTPTAVAVSGYDVDGANFLGYATAVTSVIGTTVHGVAVTSVTGTGLNVWVYRTNTTATIVNFAIIARSY